MIRLRPKPPAIWPRASFVVLAGNQTVQSDPHVASDSPVLGGPEMKRLLSALASGLILGCSNGSPILPFGHNDNQVSSPDVKQGSPSPAWAEFHLPGTGTIPVGVVAGPDRGMWFVENAGNMVDRFDIATGNVKRYPIPTPQAYPQYTTVGSDGAIWFGENGTPGNGKIGRVTTDGVVTEYSIPGGIAPYGLTEGPDGNVWFGDSGGSVGSITPSGAFHFTNTLPKNRQAFQLTTGPDGNIWFTELQGKIGKVTASGRVREYSVPTCCPLDIVSLGGAIWFTEIHGNSLGRATTDGVVTEYPLPVTTPSFLVVGPGGFLWFMYGPGGSKLATFNPTNFSTKIIGGAPHTCCLQGLAVGFDGNIWTTAAEGGRNRMVVRVLDLMKTTPPSLSISVGAMASFSIAEKRYSGPWTATSSNTNIATVLQSSPGIFSVTGTGIGSAHITVRDTIENSIAEPIAVH